MSDRIASMFRRPALSTSLALLAACGAARAQQEPQPATPPTAEGSGETEEGEVAGTVRVATQETRVRIRRIVRRLDSSTLEEIPDRARLTTTDVAEVDLEFEDPVVLERHEDLPPLGRFTIETPRDVVAAGIFTRRDA